MKKIVLALALCLAAFATAMADGPSDELIKLARSGVDEEVLLAYVESSPEAFNLSADDIIILKDLGVPSTVINAALHRGQALDSLAAASGTKPSDTETERTDAAGPAASQVVPPQGQLNISFFYDALSPYGRWIKIDSEWCWQPNAARINAGWAPYYNHGRWVYTDWGWCWVSFYSWGWAPFHYGRWFRHPIYGWCWWPDWEWGPAWVVWRFGGGYWGWAPVPRHCHYRHGHGWYHRKKRLRRDSDFGLTWREYFWVPTGHVADPKPWIHIVPPEKGREIFLKTAFDRNGIEEKNDRIFNRGPLIKDVMAGSGRTITPLPVVEKGLRVGQPITPSQVLPKGLEIYTPKVTSDIPRPPVVTPAAGGQLPGAERERLRDAAQQALEKRKADAERAERERKELLDKAKREDDQRRQEQLRIEAEVRDQRARQAREDAVRIERWKPETDVPLPPAPERPKPPQVREELREQVRTEANEELQKRQAMEDLMRKPVGQPQLPAKQERQEKPEDKRDSGSKGKAR